MERPWPRAKLAPALIGPGARVWLAEDEAGRLTGFVVARRVDDLLEIDLVGVDPRCRREGIARALLRATLAAEADAGLSEVRLEVVAGNRAALRLYEALDFVVVGRRKRYYPDGDDGLLLSWRKTRAG
jgi:ribosomal protein S18 acetylase RimI-like enzyme